jgi:hypothetical protein
MRQSHGFLAKKAGERGRHYNAEMRHRPRIEEARDGFIACHDGAQGHDEDDH